MTTKRTPTITVEDLRSNPARIVEPFELEQLLAITGTQRRALIDRGQIASVRVGRKRVCTAQALLNFLDDFTIH